MTAIPPGAAGSRTRIFGVGAAKTGTHSLGEMFADRVPSAHEAEATRVIRHILLRRMIGSSAPLRAYLRGRDSRLGLTIDSSQLNIYLIEELNAVFPDCRFVMTVRQPIDWLRSIIDDSLRRNVGTHWEVFRRYRFGSRRGLPEAERALAERGLHSLGGYLGYWRFAIDTVEAGVPADRLLVVGTPDLSRRSAEIARFCGIGEVEVPPDRARSFANPERFGVLSEIPAPYLEDAVLRTCGDTMRRHFPELDIRAEIERLQAQGA